jgi:hypothetical protein
MTMGAVCRLYSRSLERKSSRTLAPIALTIRIPDLSIKVINPAISLTSASATRNRTVHREGAVCRAGSSRHDSRHADQ